MIVMNGLVGLMASVAAASLLGSLHCVGMCGPFATLAAAKPDRVQLPIHDATRSAAAYNGGRLLVYLTLGAVAGGIGSAVDTTASWVGVQRVATALAGGSMVVVGLLGLLTAAGAGRRGFAAPGRLGTSATRVATRAFGIARRTTPQRRAALLGAATGLMPCGWLWAFVLSAAATANAWSGAGVMLAFWLGTIPALVAVAFGARHMGQRLRRHLTWLMPLLVGVVGVFTLTARLAVTLPVATPGPAPAAGNDGRDHDRGIDDRPRMPAVDVPGPEQAPCH